MLEIDGLEKRYGTVVALDGASFTARPGRLVGFLGPNGAGKTTTMRCVFGLVVPERGEIRWEGRPIRPGTVCGSATCPNSAGSTRGCGSATSSSTSRSSTACRGRDARAAAASWLERMGLADRTKSKTEDLSHGNQQRVQLATALVHDPELLVLDEPFSGLDPLGIATMADVLRERAAAGVGVIFSVAPARPRRGRVRGRRDHQPRAGRRGRRDRGAAARSGRRHLDVEVDGLATAPGSTADDRFRVLERDGGRVRLLVEGAVDLDGAARPARAAGEVRRFSYEPPQLSELFMEAISAPQPSRRGGGVMSRLRSIWLVARREILERGRSRGYLLSLAVHVVLLGAGFVIPSCSWQRRQTMKVGDRRRRRRRGLEDRSSDRGDLRRTPRSRARLPGSRPAAERRSRRPRSTPRSWSRPTCRRPAS